MRIAGGSHVNPSLTRGPVKRGTDILLAIRQSRKGNLQRTIGGQLLKVAEQPADDLFMFTFPSFWNVDLGNGLEAGLGSFQIRILQHLFGVLPRTYSAHGPDSDLDGKVKIRLKTVI